MKHIAYLCLLLLITGCSQTEFVDRQEVRFSTSIESDSRATDVGFEAGDQIAVFAMNETTGSSNVRYVYDNGFKAAGVPIYYPEDGSALSFYAVYPYGAFVGDYTFWFTVAENQSQAQNYDLSNLMTAATELTTELTPHLQFKHQMANVWLSVQNKFADFEITEIRFINWALTMNYDLLSDEMVYANEFGNILPRHQDGYYMVLVPPQSKEQNEEIISVDGSLSDGRFVSFTLAIPRKTDFKAGFRYEYTLSIDERGYYNLK